jgi:predicted nucleic acid-binding protein
LDAGLITFDTSGLVVAMNVADQNYHRVMAALAEDPGPYLIPSPILAEIAYILERRLGHQIVDAFLDDLATGQFVLDCGEPDIPRIRTLIARYADFPLGFADAVVIACAERHGGRVLTLDLRHFGVIAREGTITPVP